MRLLQSEGPNAGVFDVYESEITSLRNELERTRAECSELEATCRDAQLQLDASRASGPGSPPGYGAAVDGKLARVRSWRRSLAQSEKEAAAARAQLAEAGKKLRQAEVYRKGHEDSTKKLRKLTAEHERQGQEVIELRLSLSELTNAKQQLLDETARANDAVAAAERRAAAAEEGHAKAEKERTRMVFERRRDTLYAKAPRLAPPPEPPRRVKFSSAGAGEVLKQLEAEIAQHHLGRAGPKVQGLLAKAVREVASLEMATQESAAREEEMLAMLVAHMRDDPPPDASAAGASRMSVGTAATRSGVGR